MERRGGLLGIMVGMTGLGLLMASLLVIPRQWLLPRPALQQIPSESEPDSGAYPGDLAADFSLPGLDLAAITLSDQRGQRVLLNFFSTWCEACRAEMPGVQAQFEKHREHGWVFIGIDIQEPPEEVAVFRDEFGLTFPIALDRSGHVAHRYAIAGTPTTITIDPQGWIVDRRLGYMSETDIEEMLAALP